MVKTDYPVEALGILLEKDRLPERYHPLIRYRNALIAGLKKRGCVTKRDALALPDAAFADMGITEPGDVRLLRRFFILYDPDPRKLAGLEKAALSPEERAAYRELYCLPGVKSTRAMLYYRCGLRSVRDMARAEAETLRASAARVIRETCPGLAVPLPKEVRTQIAVARAFTYGLDRDVGVQEEETP